MSALNLSENKITHRQQIVQLLRMAIDQRWRFSYVSVIRNHVESRPIALISVNAGEGTFSVDREIERPEQQSNEPVMFRAQSGGISVIFKSRVSEATDVSKIHQIDLPYEVRCTQLRKSTRIDLDSMSIDVPVVLYLAMGFELEGTLADISMTGAQFKVPGDVTEKFKNLQMLEACKISLPDNFVLRASAQLMGINFYKLDDATILRTQLVDMEAHDEERLEQFIDGALAAADSSLVVITSDAE